MRPNRIRHGRVLPANRYEQTPNYWNTPQSELVIDVQRPGRGFRHVVRKHHVERFVELIPHWDEHRVGLNAIVLASARAGLDGWYGHAGIIGICAWERDIVADWDRDYFLEHAPIIDRLGVLADQARGDVRLHFTEGTARAFLLLHVFLHELGHHVDLMTTRNQTDCARGEAFAEAFAFEQEERVRDAYFRTIGLD